VSESELPLVTIVTPSFNTVKYLAQAVESVLAQDYPRIEYIVVDGGSTDGSLDLLAGYKGRLSYTTSPDRGPSEAAFKGFRQAHGEILAWLNTDDTYLPGAIRTAVDHLQANADADVVYGEGWWIDENGGVISRYPTLPFDPKVLERDCFICQPAAFMRASSYRRCELDPEVNRSFDYDLWIRMAKAGFRFDAIPQYLANSRMHRGALTFSERFPVFMASMTLLQRHYGYVPLPWIFGYTAYRIDRRDQFFESLQPTPWKYLAALPIGLSWNRRRPFRFLAEWIAAPFRYLTRRLSGQVASGKSNH
jgi:glycosyltransferase involved in cell wall biosynthesis